MDRYIYVTNWEDFVSYPHEDKDIAFDYKNRTPTYKIEKSL